MESAVNGFDGIYTIDEFGVIMTLDRTVLSRERATGVNTRTIQKRELGRDCSSGYVRVTLCKDGVSKKYLLHRLVAIAFIPNPDNKRCVNHKDGNKLNNHISNLEWCTHKENERHSWDVLGKKIIRTRKIVIKVLKGRKGRVVSAETRMKISLGNKGKTGKMVVLNGETIFNSIAEAAIKTGCKRAAIVSNLRGRNSKTRYGIWEYYKAN